MLGDAYTTVKPVANAVSLKAKTPKHSMPTTSTALAPIWTSPSKLEIEIIKNKSTNSGF